jgi:hypothetical protein
MRRKGAVALATVSLLMMVVPLRAATIKLTHREYAPTLSASLKQAYQGTHVYFYDFTNEAEDTGLWSYGSETKQAKYKIQDNRLNYYLLYCFQVAGRSLGMVVYDKQTPSPDLRGLDLVLTSWSHERFRARVLVYRGGVKRVEKAFHIEFETAHSVLPDDLKQRAYDCITKVFTTILEDKEVREALLSPAAGS